MAKLVLATIAIFILGIIARIIALNRKSQEIQKTLDYSKMKEWEDEDDD